MTGSKLTGPFWTGFQPLGFNNLKLALSGYRCQMSRLGTLKRDCVPQESRNDMAVFEE